MADWTFSIGLDRSSSPSQVSRGWWFPGMEPIFGGWFIGSNTGFKPKSTLQKVSNITNLLSVLQEITSKSVVPGGIVKTPRSGFSDYGWSYSRGKTTGHIEQLSKKRVIVKTRAAKQEYNQLAQCNKCMFSWWRFVCFTSHEFFKEKENPHPRWHNHVANA